MLALNCKAARLLGQENFIDIPVETYVMKLWLRPRNLEFRIDATRRGGQDPANRATFQQLSKQRSASLVVDPTPASICRLALIQLPRRQLPRWYTCGRFIASTVIRVQRSPLLPPLSPSVTLSLPSIFATPFHPLFEPFLVLFHDPPSLFRVDPIAVPRSDPRGAPPPW